MPLMEPGEVVIGLGARAGQIWLASTLRFFVAPQYAGTPVAFTLMPDSFVNLGMSININSLMDVDRAASGEPLIVTGSIRVSRVLYAVHVFDAGLTSTGVTLPAGITPGGLSVDGGGAVYLSQQFDHDSNSETPTVWAIAKYPDSSTGTASLLFGHSGPGALVSPAAVEAGPNGLIYILDTNVPRIVIFNSSGVFQSSFDLIEPVMPSALAVDSLGRLYTVAAAAVDGANVIGVYDTSSGTHLGSVSAGNRDINPDGRPTLAIAGNDLYFNTGTGNTVEILRLDFPPPEFDAGVPVVRPGPNQAVTVKFNVYNQGRGTSAPSVAQAYVTTDGDPTHPLSPDDRLQVEPMGLTGCSPCGDVGALAQGAGTSGAFPEEAAFSVTIPGSGTGTEGTTRFVWIVVGGDGVGNHDAAGQTLPGLKANDRKLAAILITSGEP